MQSYLVLGYKERFRKQSDNVSIYPNNTSRFYVKVCDLLSCGPLAIVTVSAMNSLLRMGLTSKQRVVGYLHNGHATNTSCWMYWYNTRCILLGRVL